MTAVTQSLLSPPGNPGVASQALFGIFAGEAARMRALFALCLLIANVVVGTILNGFWHPGRSFSSIAGETLYWSTIGSLIWWLCVTVADAVSASRSRRWIVYAFTGFFAGLAASVLWLLPGAQGQVEGTRNSVTPMVAEVWWQVVGSAVLKSTLVTVAYYYSLRWRSGRAVLDGARLERALLTRRATETRLHAMQARVNPQFLFDTLAQVERLCDSEPGRADRMLECLITYLRSATPLVDDISPALASEIALAESFLELVRIRCDERFAYDIEVSDIAKGARLPPMLLLPLIEPASLFSERSPESPSISLSFNVDEARQRLVVRARFAATNPYTCREAMLIPIRERLAELYGDAASLVVARAEPRATSLVMEIPHERTERSDR